MKPDDKIYVAGHRGLAGAAIVRRLKQAGYANLLTRTHSELDLTDQAAVAVFFARHKPDHVFLAAAKVGGINANQTYPAQFIHQNLAIQTNVIHQSYLHGVKRLLFLGSSCIYPKHTEQPIEENALMTGLLEPSNQAYAVAKIAGIQMCWSYNREYGKQYIALMPNNLYGPDDNFDLLNSHVLPAMIRKFHLARLAEEHNWDAIEKDARIFGPIPDDIRQSLGMPDTQKASDAQAPHVLLWGSGRVLREFLHTDDLADACLFVMAQPWQHLVEHSPDPWNVLFNVGYGKDQSIARLAETIAGIVGFKGRIHWNAAMPDGTPRKILNTDRLSRLGWKPDISLHDGINSVYQWYRQQSA